MLQLPVDEGATRAPARRIFFRIPRRLTLPIDLHANAALRWLCRPGFAPSTRVLGVSR